MPAKRTIQEIQNETPGTFAGSWGWGFGFGWIAFITSIIAMFIGKNIPVYVFTFMFFYLIIINIVKLTGMSNNAYGWTAFVGMIIGIIDIILTVIFRKGL